MTTTTTHSEGSYVDSSCWGTASNRRVVLLALANGWQPKGYIADNILSLTDEDSDFWQEASEEAEKYLNEQVSDDAHCWGWHEGNFRYQKLEWWWETDGN